jgi:hypothetical protein
VDQIAEIVVETGEGANFCGHDSSVIKASNAPVIPQKYGVNACAAMPFSARRNETRCGRLRP